MTNDLMTPFKRLASKARQEPPPKLDVADRVVRSLRFHQAATLFIERDMLVFAGVSLAIAVMALLFVWTSVDSIYETVCVDLVDESYFDFLRPLMSIVQ